MDTGISFRLAEHKFTITPEQGVSLTIQPSTGGLSHIAMSPEEARELARQIFAQADRAEPPAPTKKGPVAP